MSSARENIMQRIRRANQQRLGAMADNVLQRRMSQHSRGPQPHWSEELKTRFVHKAVQSAAHVTEITSSQEVVAAVQSYLEEQSLENRLLCSDTALINGLEWPETITVEYRTATTEDRVVLVEAFAAIAETGSVVMCSGQATPVSLNFLPDHFLCVVRRENIVRIIEDLWEKIRQEMSSMPRAVNIITGPSRTADVEQIIQLGAHGPRKVHLLLLN